MLKLKYIFIYVLTAVLIASCAEFPRESPPELYWPFPPEKPRVKFLELIIGSIDVVGVRGKFHRLLFGEETEVTFRKPAYIAVKDNVLYITDVGVIHVYDFNKRKFKILGRGLLGNATGIAVSPDGRVFVSDSARKQVFVFNPEDNTATIWTDTDVFETPAGLEIDEVNERLLVVDSKKHNVTVWSLNGDFLFSIGGRGRDFGEFNFPYDVAVDKEGKIYVIDTGNFRVQIFDKDGKFLSAFGGVGSNIGSFARPKGIALDSAGHIYIVDSAFGNFQIFGPDGSVYLVVGSNGNEPGKFTLPMGIFIDKDDKIYVVDQINRRIQVFQYIKYENG
ncbi:MAG: 6-bladed beta-propeller [Nitrospirae bacterium]|nr:6-bladed beta-propeller [Nitrospirota bacterium]